ncbi:MAG: hypothetical protein K2Q01_10340, partial [Rickettsiales bacterium]|nr:hypothetical protein [Rickettsiales bacterium]
AGAQRWGWVWAACAGVLFLLAYHPWQNKAVMAGLPRVQAMDYARARRDIPAQGFIAFQNYDEFLPVLASAAGLTNRFSGKIAGFEAQTLGVGLSEIKEGAVFSARVSVSGALPAQVVINQFYFPGWEVEVNGQALSMQAEDGPARLKMGGSGRMLLVFGRNGDYFVRAFYAGPPHWRERNMAVVLGLVLLGAAYARFLRPQQKDLSSVS